MKHIYVIVKAYTLLAIQLRLCKKKFLIVLKFGEAGDLGTQILKSQ